MTPNPRADRDLAPEGRPAVIVSPVKQNPHPRIALATLLAAACAPSAAEPPPARSLGVAPSAAIVRPAKRHFDVLDFRATPAPWVCLDAERAGDVSILVVLQDPVIAGAVLVTDPDGEVLETQPIRRGDDTVEILTDTPAGSPALCLHLQATEGATVFELRWRYR